MACRVARNKASIPVDRREVQSQTGQGATSHFDPRFRLGPNPLIGSPCQRFRGYQRSNGWSPTRLALWTGNMNVMTVSDVDGTTLLLAFIIVELLRIEFQSSATKLSCNAVVKRQIDKIIQLCCAFAMIGDKRDGRMPLGVHTFPSIIGWCICCGSTDRYLFRDGRFAGHQRRRVDCITPDSRISQRFFSVLSPPRLRQEIYAHGYWCLLSRIKCRLHDVEEWGGKAAILINQQGVATSWPSSWP